MKVHCQDDTVTPNSLSPIEIYAIRRTLGMTQPELAAELGVSRQTVKYWENGTYAPRNEHETALWSMFDAFAEEANRILREASASEDRAVSFPDHPVGSAERRKVSALAVFIMAHDPSITIDIEGQTLPEK